MANPKGSSPEFCIQSVLWKEYMKSGSSAIKRGDLREAAKKYSLALDTSRYFDLTDRRSIESLKALAMVELELKNFQRAETLFTELAGVVESLFGPNGPEAVDALLHLLRVYETQGELRKARDTLRQVLTNNPQIPANRESPYLKALQSKLTDIEKKIGS